MLTNGAPEIARRLGYRDGTVTLQGHTVAAPILRPDRLQIRG
jgi:hypothetical protein